jgi:hypothetical protein
MFCASDTASLECTRTLRRYRHATCALGLLLLEVEVRAQGLCEVLIEGLGAEPAVAVVGDDLIHGVAEGLGDDQTEASLCMQHTGTSQGYVTHPTHLPTQS